MVQPTKAKERLTRHYLELARIVGENQDFQTLDQDWYQVQVMVEYSRRRDDEIGVVLFSGLTIALSDYWNARGMYSDEVKWYLQARNACMVANRPKDEGIHLRNLGRAYRELGQIKQAMELYNHALAIAQEVGDRQGECICLSRLGLVQRDLGHYALQSFEEALAIAREIGDRFNEGNCLGHLGDTYREMEENIRAIEYHEQALVIAREIGNRRGENAALTSLGLAYAALGQSSKAISFYSQALIISREIGHRQGESAQLGNIGSAYRDMGLMETAIEYHKQALAISRQIGHRQHEASDLYNLGSACADLGEVDEARQYLQESLTIFEETGSSNVDLVRYILDSLPPNPYAVRRPRRTR